MSVHGSGLTARHYAAVPWILLVFAVAYIAMTREARGVAALSAATPQHATALTSSHHPTPSCAPTATATSPPRKRFLLAVTNCNGADMVDRLLTLSSLPAHVQPFIFDDASHEDTREVRDVAAAHGAQIYQALGPRGLTYAWNAAFHYFKVSSRNYSHLCVANNDVVIPAGALEALEAAMDTRPDIHLWGPVTMPGGLGARTHVPVSDRDVLTPSSPQPRGIYGQQQLNLLYPGLPHRLGAVLNVEPGRAGEVQAAISASGALQAAMEAGRRGGVAALHASLEASNGNASGWPEFDGQGRPVNSAGAPHAGWAPPSVFPLVAIPGMDRHLLGFFLCMARSSIAMERRPGGDWVRDSLLNLHGEGDLRDAGWIMGVASRAFVWHSKASTLPQTGGVDRDDLRVCHAAKNKGGRRRRVLVVEEGRGGREVEV